MRKLFTERTRLVVYLERSDFDMLTDRARSEGKTLVEWARDILIGGNAIREVRLPDTPTPRPKPAARSSRPAGDAGPAQPPVPVQSGDLGVSGRCVHRKQRGELCYKCDPKFGLPSLI